MIPGILKRVAVNQQVPYPYLSMKHDYIETSVCSNDGNMAEYRIVSTNKRMSCYIPSKAGERFSIVCMNSLSHDVALNVYFDGRLVNRSSLRANSSGLLAGSRTQDDMLRPFIFSVIDTTEDDSAPINDINLEMLGVIQVDYFRTTVVNEGVAGNVAQQNFREIGPVSERTKKAGVHHVALDSASVKARKQHMDVVNYIDPGNQPYLTFIFYYRPQEILQAQGIMPPCPISADAPCSSVQGKEFSRAGHGSQRQDGHTMSLRNICWPGP